VCLGADGIAVLLPGGDFIDEGLFVVNAALAALGGQNAEAFNPPPRFGSRESLISPTASEVVVEAPSNRPFADVRTAARKTASTRSRPFPRPPTGPFWRS